MEHFGPENPLTNLVPKLNGIDPDDAFSSVPYEKGSTLLNYLEGLLGGAGDGDMLVQNRTTLKSYRCLAVVSET